MKIHCLPAFQDNYFWIIETEHETAVVDPGEGKGVLSWCESNKKPIDKILLTHHHNDHCGGVRDLKEAFDSKVYASLGDRGRIQDVDIWLEEGNVIDVGSEIAKVKTIPGHTTGHIAFWFENKRTIFVGDTLFALGCGRLFGGTAVEMWESLKWIKQLPLDTEIFCAHEYTLGNLKFVKYLLSHIARNEFIEKKDKLICEREKKLLNLRKENTPTVPFFLRDEIETNPFLWCNEPDFSRAFSKEKKEASEIFADLRELKNQFH